MIDIHLVEERLRSIEYESQTLFLRRLLEVFELPSLTIKKVIDKLTNSSDKSAVIYRRAFVFIIDEKNNPERFAEVESEVGETYPLLLGLGSSEIWVNNLKNKKFLKFHPTEVSNYVDFFVPLIYGLKEEKDLYATLDFSEIIGRLFNHLSTLADNKNRPSDVSMYLLNLLYIGFAQSLIEDKELKRFFEKYSNFIEANFNFIIEELISVVLLGKESEKLSLNLPRWAFVDATGLSLPQIDKVGFDLSIKLLSQNLKNIDIEILGSLIYKFVGDDEQSSIYGHYTSYENVNKLLHPLFISEYEKLISSNFHNKSKLQEIRKKLLNSKYFDPTNGPGSFLSAAFNSVTNLLEVIDARLGVFNSHEQIQLENFIGLVGNDISFYITKLSVWVTYLQYLSKLRTINNDDLINAHKAVNVTIGNQLTMPWNDVCANLGETYIIGSPVFKGAKKLNQVEKKEMEFVYKSKSIGDLDYSSCWLILASKYIKSSNSKSAFVLTNSVCQGVQVEGVWKPIYSNKCEILFAHRSFKWLNGASSNTGVTVIIVGLTAEEFQPEAKNLIDKNVSINCKTIGPYLICDSKVIICKRTKPLSKILPEMLKGNMPYDDQNLLLDKNEKNELIKKSLEAARFLKKIVGSDEFINSIPRWCLWISADDFKEAEKISLISARIESVRKFRLSKTDLAAKKLAERPYQFREFRISKKHTLVIPSVSSENRRYIPIGFVGKDTVVSNLAFAIYDCEYWIFGVIASKMHMIWIRTVCGALETRIRYSSRLGYNTFPFPDISLDQKKRISEIVMEITAEREIYCNRSLGELYSNLPQNLLMLHQRLDQLIDQCYQIKPFESDMERINLLFNLYENYTE